MAHETAGARLGWAAAGTAVLMFGAGSATLEPHQMGHGDGPRLREAAPSAPSRLALAADDVAPDCPVRPGAVKRSRDLLDGTLTLSRHEPMALPADPTWAEDPFDDRNWEFQYHSLRFTWDLFEAWRRTGDARFLDRALFLLRDWVRDNPPGAGRSDFSWNDHSTAWRTVVLACALGHRPESRWLRAAVHAHAAVLADPGFYVGVGNHALNQSRGLLSAACVLERPDWQRLATDRIARLIESSVDDEGVTNEQSVFYQLYNLEAYRGAAERLEACGVEPPRALRRVARMIDMLTHATLPDGRYASLGDTAHSPAAAISGTTAEYAATEGRHGPRPRSTFATFKAGFVFGRTGWGEQRKFRDEVVWTGRFGPGRAFHGHLDHGAVTLFGFGRRLVDDPGLFTLNANAWRTFATGRSAHNVVTVDGVRYDATSRATLVAAASDARHDDVTIRDRGYPGVDMHRRIVFSRRMGWLLVDDRATSTRSRTFRQLWHLLPGSNVGRAGPAFRTYQAGGNLLMLQLLRPDATGIVEGQRAPIQGWYSTGLNRREAAPVVQAATTGERVRYVTLLVPLPYCNSNVRVSDVSATASVTRFTVSVDGDVELVEISDDGAVLSTGPTEPGSTAARIVRRAAGRAEAPLDRTAQLCREPMQQGN